MYIPVKKSSPNAAVAKDTFDESHLEDCPDYVDVATILLPAISFLIEMTAKMASQYKRSCKVS